ncbi:MAG: hypothetical protein V1721_05620 [Pseudomonadota bacterium]
MKTGKSIYRFYLLPFKYLYKFLIFAIFIIYLSSGSQASWVLLKSALINLQDASALHSIIEKNVRNDHLDSITEWVRRRPLSETATLIEIVTPESGDVEPGMFFEFSSRLLQQGETRDALFWAQLGRYRMRYDALRCGSLNAPETFDEILSLFPPYRLTAFIQLNPELLKKSVRQVMDFDAKYPARNNPAFTCSLFRKISRSEASLAPEDQWERLRLNLREVTEAFLESPDEKLK